MQPLQREKLFTNHELLTLLWPLIIEQTLSVLVGMADTVMVSSVGEAAISGVSLVDMINQLIITVFAALATGGAVVTSQYLGAKKPEQAARSAGQLVGLSALLGLAVAAFCLLTRRPMLRLLFGSITDDVMDAAVIYFTITALSFPFLALYNAGAAIFRSTSNSAVSMKVSVIVNAINFGGNAICIYLLGMGVEGVAIPTLISRAVGAFIILALAAQHVEVYVVLARILGGHGHTLFHMTHAARILMHADRADEADLERLVQHAQVKWQQTHHAAYAAVFARQEVLGPHGAVGAVCLGYKRLKLMRTVSIAEHKIGKVDYLVIVLGLCHFIGDFYIFSVHLLPPEFNSLV